MKDSPTIINNIDINSEETVDNIQDNLDCTYLFTLENFKNILQKNAIKLVSKWYSNSAIPRKMVQILLDDVQNFNDSILINIKDKIQNMIQNNNYVDTVKDLTLV